MFILLKINLDTDTAVVLGIGNVAIDVARMLLTPVDVLRYSIFLWVFSCWQVGNVLLHEMHCIIVHTQLCCDKDFGE